VEAQLDLRDADPGQRRPPGPFDREPEALDTTPATDVLFLDLAEAEWLQSRNHLHGLAIHRT